MRRHKGEMMRDFAPPMIYKRALYRRSESATSRPTNTQADAVAIIDVPVATAPIATIRDARKRLVAK